MPLSPKGRSIKAAMVKRYGKKRGKQIFFASANKGTITGVDKESVSSHIRQRKRQ